jgi:hypothetical protein
MVPEIKAMTQNGQVMRGVPRMSKKFFFKKCFFSDCKMLSSNSGWSGNVKSALNVQKI